MNKKRYRFFGGLVTAQAKWLNKMADQGFRLARTEKLLYEFQPCRPGQYRYCVEFIGEKSQAEAAEYRDFLHDMGYRTFFKNINLNYSAGKVVVRPWADKGGRISTSATTFDRELLIVEKENDGKPFELHTTYEDKLRYLKTARKPAAYLFVMMALLTVLCRSWVSGVFALLALAILVRYQIVLARLRKQASLEEW